MSATDPNGDYYGDSCLEEKAWGAYPVYLMLLRSTAPMVGGFECRFWTEGGVDIVGMSFPVNAINVGQYGNAIVGFGEPLYTNNGAH